MSYSTRRNRSTQAATRERLASALRELVEEFGESIELDWCGWATPWQARVVGHPERILRRNWIRYWCEQGWATRADGVDGRFMLEVEVDSIPEPQASARTEDVARRA